MVLDVLGIPECKIIMVIKIPDDYNLELGKSNVEVNIPDGTLEK